MFGWGMPDSHTIPSLLQDELQNMLPEYQVEVINHAHCYWFSSIELVHYISLLRTEENPQIVCFLDGLNDTKYFGNGMEVPRFSNQAYQGWEILRSKRDSEEKNWFTLTGSFPILRAINILKSLSAAKEAGKAPQAERYFKKPNNMYERIIEGFDYNMKIERAVSKQHNIDYFLFLQPVNWFGTYSYPKNIRFKTGVPKDYQMAYQTLITKSLTESNGFYSLHDCLYNIERPYVDYSHYSDSGSLEIAKQIAKIIKTNSSNINKLLMHQGLN